MDIHQQLTNSSKRCLWEGTVTLLSRKNTKTSRETRRFKDGGMYIIIIKEVHWGYTVSGVGFGSWFDNTADIHVHQPKTIKI